MDVSRLPLNALRAFEAAARLGSLTKAGLELHVGQTAISHQIKLLEKELGFPLFDRLPRGIALTEEAQTLLPVLTDALRRISDKMHQLRAGGTAEIVTIGVVSSFALGWLLPRLQDFTARHPHIEVRIKTNNNRADTLLDGLDLFIRFGDGAWHSTEAVRLASAPLTPVCNPLLAASIRVTGDLLGRHLLRSYRQDEWPLWFRAAGLTPPVARGWIFDSSLALVEAAAQGLGLALVPAVMFKRDIESGRIVQPFELGITTGAYWLTRLKSRPETGAVRMFKEWIIEEIDPDAE
jgi:LysR family transcriptional regulator, regulator of gene expression of beta-lactamase